MSRFGKFLLTLQLALLFVAPVVSAQDEDETQGPPTFTQAELDQMLAPIALYPDALLTQILMASTYPLEVVQAARWSRANAGLRGREAVRAVENQSWDPSVKSLVAFPRILAQMDEKLEWTQDLGDAFLAQSTQVMDTVQSLRRKAYAEGTLESGAHYRVVQRGETIVIEPAHPDVVYVPYYDPRVVYGPWWWAGYPPVYWAPWPGYYVHVGSGLHWSAGIFVGSAFFFAISDWHHHHIKVAHVHPIRRVHLHPHLPHKIWRHDWRHRHGVKYRSPRVHKVFAPPHVRHASRHDLRRGVRSAPRDHRAWRDRVDRRASRADRHDRIGSHRFDKSHGAIAQPGIGRLGMRPDRHVTSRHPNLPEERRLRVAPRAKIDARGGRLPNRGIARRGADRVKPFDTHRRPRANGPLMRSVPRTHASPAPAVQPKFHSRVQAGRDLSRGWGNAPRVRAGHRAVAPPARGLRAPRAMGRTFGPRSIGAGRSFGGFRAR